MQRHARCGPPVLGPRLLHRDGLASVCLECGVDARQQQHAWLPTPCPGAEAAGAAQGARSSRSTRSMSRCTCWTTRRTATGPTRTCARGRRTPPRRCSSAARRRPARATSTSRPTASPTATSWRAPGARGPAHCRPPLTACRPGRLWRQCWSLRFLWITLHSWACACGAVESEWCACAACCCAARRAHDILWKPGRAITVNTAECRSADAGNKA